MRDEVTLANIDPNGKSAPLGETLNLSGQVWCTKDWDNYEQFSGNISIANASFLCADRDAEDYNESNSYGGQNAGEPQYNKTANPYSFTVDGVADALKISRSNEAESTIKIIAIKVEGEPITLNFTGENSTLN